jgi:peptidoglycan/LPS O-acetylase OafA/YrhL
VSTPAGGTRALHVDALKAVASQAIVLHHLAFYGPMADHAAVLWPALFEVLAGEARIAVQVFLVVAGFLAARSLSPDGRLKNGLRPGTALVDRYLRLMLPYAAMLFVAVAASALADAWIDHPSISAPPTLAQWLAHVLLLHDLLGFEALSAGVWYVAIDLQLFALLLALLAVARAVGRRARARTGVEEEVAAALVLAAMAVSLLVLNRDSRYDVVAPYFFGAYGLGVVVAWWGRPGRGRVVGLLVAAVLVALALAVEWRSRIALAGLVALLLLASLRHPRSLPRSVATAVHALGRISYAIFLIHFPLCLVVNAAFERFLPHTPWVQLAGVVVAWVGSVVAGAVFHRAVEAPAMRWVGGWRPRRPQAA